MDQLTLLVNQHIKFRWGQSAEEMKIKNADEFIKFALGENVKQSNWGDQERVRFHKQEWEEQIL